jgi:restriction endonuclease
VVYDSDIEENFAQSFEQNGYIKLYVKLPGWFKIGTPLGGYNPDWAVLYEKDGEEKLYFVVETKSSLFSGDLRVKEQAKIAVERILKLLIAKWNMRKLIILIVFGILITKDNNYARGKRSLRGEK